MKHTSRILYFAALSLSACHESTQPAPSTQSSPPLATPESAPSAAQDPVLGPHRSPVTVKLLGPEQVSAGQDIEVVAEVAQFVGSNAAVQLHLQLPAGARLVSGNETEQLPSGNGKLTRRFVLHLDTVPLSDIEVFATTKSNSFGARAKSVYRFGRPEPRLADPPRAGSPLVVSGRNLGNPIQLKPNNP